jgi:hypothetical protein
MDMFTRLNFCRYWSTNTLHKDKNALVVIFDENWADQNKPEVVAISEAKYLYYVDILHSTEPLITKMDMNQISSTCQMMCVPVFLPDSE